MSYAQTRANPKLNSTPYKLNSTSYSHKLNSTSHSYAQTSANPKLNSTSYTRNPTSQTTNSRPRQKMSYAHRQAKKQLRTSSANILT